MTNLSALSSQPYQALVALEGMALASRGLTTGMAAADQAWVGLLVKLGDDALLLARDDIAEVIKPPSATRVPLSKGWLRGVCNIRGSLLPIVDLVELLTKTPSMRSRNMRLIVLKNTEMPLAVLVDEVIGFRSFSMSQKTDFLPELPVAFKLFVNDAFRQGENVWAVFDFLRFLGSDSLKNAWLGKHVG